jgi:hypothetical protein
MTEIFRARKQSEVPTESEMPKPTKLKDISNEFHDALSCLYRAAINLRNATSEGTYTTMKEAAHYAHVARNLELSPNIGNAFAGLVGTLHANSNVRIDSKD